MKTECIEITEEEARGIRYDAKYPDGYVFFCETEWAWCDSEAKKLYVLKRVSDQAFFALIVETVGEEEFCDVNRLIRVFPNIRSVREWCLSHDASVRWNVELGGWDVMTEAD